MAATYKVCKRQAILEVGAEKEGRFVEGVRLWFLTSMKYCPARGEVKSEKRRRHTVGSSACRE